MHNLEIDFGKNLTAISGQNGTGKSTILGMVGHIFDYKGKEKTKNNEEFKAKYGDIFRFCPFNDITDTYEYEVIVQNEKNKEIKRQASSRFIKGEGKHGRFRIDIGDRYVSGKGALNLPVIYLGLKRLFPLASEKEDSIRIKEPMLSPNEVTFYTKYARDILILLDKTLNPQDIKSPNKEFLAMKTDEYSYYGNSAGQDNIGQLLTSILSFKDLKQKKGEKYKGGILLIDEVDATLYAGSQINLIKRLYKFSKDYNLQIIFTTHSLEVLELLAEKTEWNTQINFFETKNNIVKNLLNPSLDYIRDKILVQTARKEKVERIQALCEDSVTESWCKNLLNSTDVKKKIEVCQVPISAGTLKELSKKNHKVFKKMIFVLDGDARNSREILKRVVFLPGKHSPEKEMYKYLYSLNEEDDFWDTELHFDKQTCFRNFIDINGNDYKRWFNAKKEGFGIAYSRLFNRWKKDENNKKKVEFIKHFQQALNQIKISQRKGGKSAYSL